jgi:hypothetical protein
MPRAASTLAERPARQQGNTRAVLSATLDERDEQYTQRFDAIDRQIAAALATANELSLTRIEALRAQILAAMSASQELAEVKVAALEKAVTAAFSSAKELSALAFDTAKTAVEKAEVAHEKRLDSVNEFRAVLTTQQTTLLTRNEADARIAPISEKIDRLQGIIDKSGGISEGGKLKTDDTRAVWGIVLGAAAVVITIILALVPLLRR